MLHDGGAAQYGSDAIAGIVNLVLNDGTEGGIVDANGGNVECVGTRNSNRFGFSGACHYVSASLDF